MTLSGRFFLPGPVEVDPDVMSAMLTPVIGHRSPPGRALAERLQTGLRHVFRTRHPVLMTTGSATAMMEAAIRGGVRQRMLAVVGGTFGERFATIAELCGKDVVRLHVHPGSALEPDQLAACLDGPPVDAVSLVHCESSTGVLEPLEPLLHLLRRLPRVVSIVDAVSSVSGVDVQPDHWGADFLVAGSQKALGLPPGLCFGVASERFIDRARSIDDRGLYLDVVALHAAASDARFLHTPALPIVHALDRQLDRILHEGLEHRWARHRLMRERVEAWVASHGRCEFVAAPGRRSDTVSALMLREGRSAPSLIAELAGRGWQVAAGIHGDIDRQFRIGHMGDLEPEQLDPLFDILEPLL